MEILDLCGSWRLCQAGNPESAIAKMVKASKAPAVATTALALKAPIAATVPGCVHTDLLAAGQIPDPFYRDNETALQWIGQADWVYTRQFSAGPELLRVRRVVLRCEGLDTLATVIINGQPAGRADNMFRTWEFDVKGLLVAGANIIEIRFQSPEAYIAKMHAKRALIAWTAPNEMPGRSYIRKEPCSFGWDWGPALPSFGIWRAIQIVGYDARLKDVLVEQDHSKRGRVGLAVSVAADGRAGVRARSTLSLAGKVVAQGEGAVNSGNKGAPVELQVKSPKLWWPNGMGAQPLYDLTVELLSADGLTLDRQAKRIGLRTLRLERTKDAWGQSFQFVANGVSFFAKGANWIPADSFVTRLTREHYRRLLQDAAAVHMNMVRVWGGGIYEEDAFYDLCDELGLCVWQDFMFACASYPAFDADFTASVKAEAQDNVRRIRHHASLALWCGNNEIEAMLHTRVAKGETDWKEYDILFNKLLPAVVRKLDPQRDYWPSSPHSLGKARTCNVPTNGDAHLWGVWHGREPFEWYRGCEHRFNSEFGFQSFPAPATVESYTEPRDRNITSFIMEHHQRSGIGNTVIMQYMLDWFRLPRDFDMTLTLSQILQGMGVKYAVEHWRRSMPRGMGTLYWQLNDCWPVASWSSVDYFGRWKALHHMAGRFFAPLLISGVEDKAKGTVDIHVTSDLLKPAACDIRWRATDLGGTTLGEGSKHVVTPAGRNLPALKLDLSKELAAAGPRNILVWMELSQQGKVVSTNFVAFAKPKHMELPKPRISVQVEGDGEGMRVTLVSQVPALFVWLDAPGAHWSDNFFHLPPGQPVHVTAKLDKPITAAKFKAMLQVRSLTDTYE
jgi:beta-mannosidase